MSLGLRWPASLAHCPWAAVDATYNASVNLSDTYDSRGLQHAGEAAGAGAVGAEASGPNGVFS